MPSANVTCTFASSEPDEGTINQTSLTFTPTNFATLQTIIVTGVDDAFVDGDDTYLIVSALCTSTDTTYNGMDPRDVSVLNRDND